MKVQSSIPSLKTGPIFGEDRCALPPSTNVGEVVASLCAPRYQDTLYSGINLVFCLVYVRQK